MNFKQTQIIALLTAAGCLTLAQTLQAEATKDTDWDNVYAGVSLGSAKPLFTNHWVAGARGTDDDYVNRLDRIDSTYSYYVGFGSALPWQTTWDRDLVWGLEGEYSPKQIRNNTLYKGDDNQQTNSEHAIFEINSIGSIRGRLGVVLNDTLVAATAGVAMLDSRFGAMTSDSAGDGDSGEFIDFARLKPVIGLSAEHKLQDHFSFRGELMHYFIHSEKSTSCLGDGPCDSDVRKSYVRFDHLTTAKVGLTYHFS